MASPHHKPTQLQAEIRKALTSLLHCWHDVHGLCEAVMGKENGLLVVTFCLTACKPKVERNETPRGFQMISRPVLVLSAFMGNAKLTPSPIREMGQVVLPDLFCAGLWRNARARRCTFCLLLQLALYRMRSQQGLLLQMLEDLSEHLGLITMRGETESRTSRT